MENTKNLIWDAHLLNVGQTRHWFVFLSLGLRIVTGFWDKVKKKKKKKKPLPVQMCSFISMTFAKVSSKWKTDPIGIWPETLATKKFSTNKEKRSKHFTKFSVISWVFYVPARVRVLVILGVVFPMLSENLQRNLTPNFCGFFFFVFFLFFFFFCFLFPTKTWQTLRDPADNLRGACEGWCKPFFHMYTSFLSHTHEDLVWECPDKQVFCWWVLVVVFAILFQRFIGRRSIQ